MLGGGRAELVSISAIKDKISCPTRQGCEAGYGPCCGARKIDAVVAHSLDPRKRRLSNGWTGPDSESEKSTGVRSVVSGTRGSLDA